MCMFIACTNLSCSYMHVYHESFEWEIVFLKRFVSFRVYHLIDLEVFWPITSLFTTHEQVFFFIVVVICIVTFITVWRELNILA